MSVFKVSQDNLETFSVVTNPTRIFTSSSLGVTGNVYVFPRRSIIEKETQSLSSFVDLTRKDDDLNSQLNIITSYAKYFRLNPASNQGRLFSYLNDYMNNVNNQGSSVRKQKSLEILRFEPTFTYTDNTVAKLTVKNVLNKYYRDVYPSAQWAFTNYNSLNFFTASGVPSDSVLLYPNVEGPAITQHEGYATGTYALSGAFSFDFYINPRHNGDQGSVGYKAGTIFHLSSSYAISLISGSALDNNDKPSGFRIQLQLSHSADILPSLALPGNSPSDLVFLSDDNSIIYNTWNHVIIRWGTNLINEGTGTININGVDRGNFVIPSGTIAPPNTIQPSVLCIGNYYNSPDDPKEFFAINPALRDGLNQLSDSVSTDEPSGYDFSHPLNAEVHDLMIKRHYMSDLDISVSASQGPSEINNNDIAFFVPPFFVEEAPYRQFVGDIGGILQTPFFEVDGTTNDPFNVAMAFGVGGHYINLENYVKDFASNVFPRLHHLTGVAVTTTTQAKSANAHLYDQAHIVKRNLTILPCDDGEFIPGFGLLLSSSKVRYVDDLGNVDASLVTLDNLLSTSSLLFNTDFGSETKTVDEANEFVNTLIGPTPESPDSAFGKALQNYINNEVSGNLDPGVQTGVPLTIYNRTRDNSSNQVIFFDVSNLFYGQRILPKSFLLEDTNISGSFGHISIKLRDDGNGNIYRADALTPHATWNSVGNIYYDEGIIVIKSPHLFFYGKDQYEMSFKGEQTIHTFKVDALAPANLLNSSSHIDYNSVVPSLHANETDSEFVWISGINLHDNNMNVIAKAQLAQPVMKRPSDRLLFKLKFDL